jgi:hypothetical protein
LSSSVAKDIFISYAKGDREWAEQVCTQLEEAGIECWIAPRDIAPGVTWPAAITEAIRQCRAMIVVFSQHANESRQMAREVEVADSRHVPILPVRVAEVEPSGDMEYFLGNRQWFDLHGGKVERKRALPAAIASLLGQLELSGVAAAAPAPIATPVKRGSPKWIPLALAVGVAAAGAGFYALSSRSKETPPAQVQNSTPPSSPVAAPEPAKDAAPKSIASESAPPKPRLPQSGKQDAPSKAVPEVAASSSAAPKAGKFEGKWEAEVKYSWGVNLKEVYVFKVDEAEVIGTASYLRVPRGILDGKIDGNRISFLTKTQTILGSQTYEEKHLYKGRLIGDAIEFILQTDSGYDTRPPEMFTAKRLE